MKALLTLVALLTWAGTASANAIGGFKCEGSGTGVGFAVQFTGARYADSFQLNNIEDDIKKLLLAGEQELKVVDTHLDVAIAIGACEKGQGDTLVTCRFDPIDKPAWTISDIGFTATQKLGKNFHQTVQITRNVKINKLDLKVLKQGTKAVLDLKMNVDTPEAEGLDVRIARDLGPLEQDWYMCKYY